MSMLSPSSRRYAPLVTLGSYCVVFDSIVEDMPADTFPDRPWAPGNNPQDGGGWNTCVSTKTDGRKAADGARLGFSRSTVRSRTSCLMTVAPDGYLNEDCGGGCLPMPSDPRSVSVGRRSHLQPSDGAASLAELSAGAGCELQGSCARRQPSRGRGRECLDLQSFPFVEHHRFPSSLHLGLRLGRGFSARIDSLPRSFAGTTIFISRRQPSSA